MLARCGHQRIAHFVHVAAISNTYRKTKPHTGVAIMPVGYRRIYEFRVRHNDGDIVVGHNHCTPRADLTNCAQDACYFDTISNRDRSFRQDDQTADEITGDILQAKSDTDANRASKNRQCGEMDASVLQNKENANHQNDVADDLGNGVLQRPIQPALRKQTVEKKTFRSRRKPKHSHQQSYQQENLNKAQADCRKWRGPSQRNSRSINRGDSEKDNGGQTQDRRDDRDEVCVDLESAEETPNDLALQKSGNDHSGGEKSDEGDQSQDRHVTLADMKQRLLEKRHFHALV